MDGEVGKQARRGLNHQQITLSYLGQLRAPYTSHDIVANRFRLLLRDLAPAEQSRIEERIRQVAEESLKRLQVDAIGAGADPLQGAPRTAFRLTRASTVARPGLGRRRQYRL